MSRGFLTHLADRFVTQREDLHHIALLSLRHNREPPYALSLQPAAKPSGHLPPSNLDCERA